MGHPLYPWTVGQTNTLTYIMSSRSTSHEPKSQLTINPALKRKQSERRKFSIKKSEGKKESSQSKSGRKQKRKKIPDRGSEENIRNMQRALWTRQYLDNTELSPSKQKKKGNHDLKWSSPFDCQPKSCPSMACSPHTKQKQKRKRPRTLKAKIPTKKQTIPKKKSY